MLVAHPDAPLRTRQAHIFSAAEIIDISDVSARLQSLYDRNERIRIAARNDCAVDALAACQFQNLLVNGAVFVADKIGSAILPRCFYADGPCSDRKDSGRAPKGCARHRH